ncbi:MAG TPA: DUF1259 domain-containing protein [Candidatus Limnocylindrales bacterium]|nr:DUF1259 domain-containing protein [Candidatus Limnocylindrales bacterium]
MFRCTVFFIAVVLFLGLTTPAHAQEIPKDYQEVLTTLGRKGDFSAGVLKIGVPRNDLSVSIAGIATPTVFGFSGWVAMTKGDGGNDVLMGDLVLLQEEVNPVMSALLSNGLEATALHNHFFWDNPRLFFMHVHGYGKAADLARSVKPALDLTGHVVSIPPAETGAKQLSGSLDTEKISAIIGHKLSPVVNWRGLDIPPPVYKLSIGRDDLSIKEHGATINAQMGLNTWAAFYGSNEKAMIAGDVAMLDFEVSPVLKALRENGLDVVAIHHHMLGTSPTIIFLHYWGLGPAEKLAAGFKAAVDAQARAGSHTHQTD